MIVTWGFFVKLHPFYYFAMSYVFGFLSLIFYFFSPKRKNYSKLCSPAKIGYKRGKKKVGKN